MQRLWSVQSVGMTKFLANFLNASPITIHDLINAISIPATYGSHSLHCVLHRFSDASTTAFAVAVYLRTINKDGSITVSLLAVKSKVVPFKTISVPRLELSAALLFVRLMHFARLAPTSDSHC